MAYIVTTPGTMAKMGSIDISVLAVIIRGSNIQYEVSWVIGGDRKTAWIEEFEISKSDNTIEVGFKE